MKAKEVLIAADLLRQRNAVLKELLGVERELDGVAKSLLERKAGLELDLASLKQQLVDLGIEP